MKGAKRGAKRRAMKLEDFVGKNPFDRAAWPERITAKVVQPGAAPRLCGYDLHRDLAGIIDGRRRSLWP